MALHHSFIKLFEKMETGDWIEIISILINSLLAIWIVRTVQNKLTNKRVLKDHLINEIKDIRVEYQSILNKLYKNELKPQSIPPWFKLMNIKLNDLLNVTNAKYKIDQHFMNPYQLGLRDLVTQLPEFEKNYQKNLPIKLSVNSQNQILQFQQKNSKLFNNLIIKINDSN